MSTLKHVRIMNAQLKRTVPSQITEGMLQNVRIMLEELKKIESTRNVERCLHEVNIVIQLYNTYEPDGFRPLSYYEHLLAFRDMLDDFVYGLGDV